MAYWVVAGVGALSAALAWIAIVEPRTLLRRAKVPAGAAPPHPALLAVLRSEVAGMLRDFWTVLKIPTFMVLMTEVPHPGLMQHTRKAAHVGTEELSALLHVLLSCKNPLESAMYTLVVRAITRPCSSRYHTSCKLRVALTMAVCGAQHVLTGAMYQSMGYQTMYLQVCLGGRARRGCFPICWHAVTEPCMCAVLSSGNTI